MQELTPVNIDRFWKHLMSLGEITDPDRPYTRRSFSDRFLEGRAWLRQKMQAAGLDVQVDASGNLIGKKPGKYPELGTIVIGSHTDSVPSGGRFDGIAGVIAGLECAHALNDAAITLNHDLEIIDFLAEEPSEWGVSCIGSRGMSGFLGPELLALVHPKTQETLSQAMVRMGAQPDQRVVRHDIKYGLELHIEQGCVLENTEDQLGIVTGIVGIVRLKMVIQGQAAHAGTTPMNMRKDASVVAAEITLATEALAHRYAEKTSVYFVATQGQTLVYPNASNVVPGRVELVFDIRSNDPHCLDNFTQELHTLALDLTQKRGLTLTAYDYLNRTSPTQCDPYMMEVIEKIGQGLGYRCRRMPSGAGHDMAFISHVAPVAMIFVPSVEGKSHCAEEWTEKADLARGLQVLYQTLCLLDQRSSQPGAN